MSNKSKTFTSQHPPVSKRAKGRKAPNAPHYDVLRVEVQLRKQAKKKVKVTA